MNKKIVFFLLAVTAHQAESSYTIGSYWQNFSYYKNLGIKTIPYPFVQFWNSTRSTKFAIGAVGALLIAGYLLRPLSTDIINNELNEIERMISNLKKLKNLNKKKTLMNQHNQELETNLIKNISEKINLFETTHTAASEAQMHIITDQQKSKFEKLKKEFEALRNNE